MTVLIADAEAQEWVGPDGRIPWAAGGIPADDLNPPPITVAAALARTGGNLVALTGTETTGERVATIANDVTYDLRSFESIGYSDWDAANDSAECVTECGTAHGTASKAVNLSPDAATTGLVVVGGNLHCDNPTSNTWEIRKHGRAVQTALDNDINPYPISGGSNDTVMVLLTITNGGWAYCDGARSYNSQDSFRDNSADAATSPTIYLRNIWAERVCDTLCEAENGALYRIYDSLIDGAYGLFDSRNNGANQSAKQHIVEYSAIRLTKLPGGFQAKTTESHHDKVNKEDSNAPRLHLRHCVLALDDDTLGSDNALGLYAADTYTDVEVLWLGTGAYPGTQLTGMTIVNQDGNSLATAQARWDTVAANWKSRHGVGAGTPATATVDMAKMIAPDPLYWPPVVA